MEQLPLSLSGFASSDSSQPPKETLKDLQGETVGIEVGTTKNDGTTHLVIKNEVEVVTKLHLDLPEGARLIGKVENDGSLKILSGKELTDFTDQELLKLLPLKTPDRDASPGVETKVSANEIRQQLTDQNYYLPAKNSRTVAKQSVPPDTEKKTSRTKEQADRPLKMQRDGAKDRQTTSSQTDGQGEAERNTYQIISELSKKETTEKNSFEVELKESPPKELTKTADQKIEATVVKSQKDDSHIVEVAGEKIEVEGKIPVDEGESFPAELTERAGQWLLKGKISERSELLEKALKKLAMITGGEKEKLELTDIARVMDTQPEKPAETLLKQQGIENPDNSTVNQVQQVLEIIEFALESQNQETPELPQLLGRLNLWDKTDPAQFFSKISNSNESPQETIIRELFFSPDTETELEANTDQNELRSLLFLKFNNLPANRENIALLEPAFRENLLETEISQQLPQIVPLQEEPAPQQIKELVEAIGFDMEQQLINNPEAATASLRGQISQQFSQPSESPEFPRAAQMQSEIIKHSLASALNPDSTFIFIPYNEDGITRFMQMMIRDEREDGSPENEERWSVTLEVNLSALGLIQARLQRRKNFLAVSLKAEKPATVRLLRSRSKDLKQSLEALDYQPSVQTGKLQPKENNVVAQEMLNFSAETLKFDMLI